MKKTDSAAGTDAPAPGESRTGGPGDVESLADLAREAHELEQGAQQEAAQRAELATQKDAAREQAQQDAAAQEIAVLLGLVRTMAAPAVEALGYLKPGQTREIWSDDVLNAASGPLVAIMARHGVGLADVMQTWGPYAMLFVATAVPAVATVKAVRENRAEKEAADQARTVDAPGAAP